MGRIIVIVGGVLAVLLIAIMVIPNLIPQEVYRAKIEEEASKALGRPVKVTGNISISIFPRIEAHAGASTIANPDGFGDKPFASMKELKAAVGLWPLLFSSVEIEEFVLVEPTIALVNREDGKNNWTFNVGAEPPKPGEAPKPGGSIGAKLKDVRIENGMVSYDDRATKQVQSLSKFNLSADMDALDKPLSFNADGLANSLPFKLEAKVGNPKAMLDGNTSQVSIKAETDTLKTSLDGTLALGAKPNFDFKFNGEIPSATKLADAFQIKDLPARNVLGKLTLSGQALGTFDDITLKIAEAKHESPLLIADLKGDARIAKAITLQLDAKVTAPKLGDLATAMNITAPASAALGKAEATTKITGTLDDLTFENVNFSHNSGLLGILFAGSAHLKKDLTFAGNLTIAAPDLRKLAAAAGAQLPGGADVYKSFSLTGQTSGGSSDVLMKNAVLQFDNIKGTGEAALNFGAKPKLTGTLNTSAINITPYATASGAPPEHQGNAAKGWGNAPIDLTPLRLVDADLTLKSAGISFDKFDFGPSNVVMKLVGGKLTADLQQTSLFGGKGGASFVADGSGAKPSIALKADLDGMALKPLLVAAAGFDMVEGAGNMTIDIAGSGSTLDTLMSSLVGKGDFKFKDGVLKGVNLQELGKAAATALTTKSVSLNAFATGSQTSFDALNTSFAMTDGVAVLTGLKMDASSFNLTGSGALDIGKQKVALKLFPEFKDKKQGVNGYGLPISLAGGWDGIGFSLDWDFLAKAATSKATDKIQDELKKQLGGLIPGGQAQTPATPAPAPAAGQQAAPTPAPQSTEDRLKAEAKKALGGLLGKNK